MYQNNNKGFIALFSVIIISFVLLLMTVTLNYAGFSGRFNIFDSESKERSNELADACIEQGRLAIALDDYDPSEEVAVDIGDEHCIYEILPGGNEIKASAEINKAETIFWAEVDKDLPNIPIVDFKECPDLIPCP